MDESSGWTDTILRPVLANFLGTLAAALVVFLVGVAAGLIADVSARVWITVAAFTALGLAAAWVSV